jgi:hypothetical protein
MNSPSTNAQVELSITNTLVESDYNAYGYDPLGLVAHLCHYFFGPEWQPTTQRHLQSLVITGIQPRYGPPAPVQAKMLPHSFTPRPPPLYYGAPFPPYVKGPLVFDPQFVLEMSLCLVRRKNTDPSKALCYKKVHGMEVMDGGTHTA